MNILIRVPNWIGDAVLTLPALHSFRLNFPSSHIWLAARRWVKDLFQNLGFIEGIIPIPDSVSLKNIYSTAGIIKKYNFDTGLLFTNSFSSALLFFAARIPNRWGYAKDGRGLFLTKTPSPIKIKTQSHHVYYYLNLLEGLGLNTVSPELNFPVPESNIQKATSLLQACGVELDHLLIVFIPGAAYGTAKQWLGSHFALLGTMLQRAMNAEIVIAGAKSDMEIGRQIANQMQKKPYIIIGKTSLIELAGVLKIAGLVISNDSGPMHLANAIHTPIVAVFGPTNPQVTGPFQQPAVVIKKEVPCWPCKYRDCPLDHRCMMEISPEEVFLNCQEILK